MDVKIVRYYKMCGIVKEKDKMIPLINQVGKRELDVMFTEKQKEGQLRTEDGILYFKQKVIAGGCDRCKIKVLAL